MEDSRLPKSVVKYLLHIYDTTVKTLIYFYSLICGVSYKDYSPSQAEVYTAATFLV